jgi:hypothetical protein
MVKLGLIGSGLFIAGFLFFKQTQEFSIPRITSHLENRLESLDPGPLPKILNQDFHYLGSGGQCFAFASADGQYVIKFFRQHTLKHLLWLRKLPWPKTFLQNHFKKITRCENKLYRDFRSYQLAFEELKNETGLIYLHLNKTKGLQTKIHLLDQLHVRHTVDADDVEFIIQKKAEPFIPYLELLLKENDRQTVRRAFQSVILLVKTRFSKGIIDEDPRLYNNIGFLNSEAVFIDAGRFKHGPSKVSQNWIRTELPRFFHRLKNWLEIEQPDLIPLLDALIQEAVSD